VARPRGSKKAKQQQERLLTGGGKLVGYIRVSTEGQQTNGHSLAGQEQRLQEACERAGFELVTVQHDVASGAKSDRDGLAEAQAMVEQGLAEGLVFAKLDRVSRSLLHSAKLVEWARAGGFTMLSADEGPMIARGQLVNEALPFFQALAQVERERISRRTREGLAAARAKGVALGCPVRRACGDPAVQRAIALRRQGLTLQAIADRLARDGVRGARGGNLTPAAVWGWVERCAPELNQPFGLSRGGAVAQGSEDGAAP